MTPNTASCIALAGIAGAFLMCWIVAIVLAKVAEAFYEWDK